VTAPEISDIRGVNTSGVISTLLDKKLITTAGRKEVMGRPILYKTSKEFLMRFGLSDLDELPSLKEFEALAREALGTDEGIAHGDVTEEQVAELHPEVDAAHAAEALDRHSHASAAEAIEHVEKELRRRKSFGNMRRWRRRKECRAASWMKIRHLLTRRRPRPGNKSQPRKGARLRRRAATKAQCWNDCRRLLRERGLLRGVMRSS